jgi:hypothetical protein
MPYMAIKGALLIAATPYSSFSSLGSYIREYWQLVTATSILEADEKDGGAVNAPALKAELKGIVAGSTEASGVA